MIIIVIIDDFVSFVGYKDNAMLSMIFLFEALKNEK